MRRIRAYDNDTVGPMAVGLEIVDEDPRSPVPGRATNEKWTVPAAQKGRRA
jgi:hypothetical protein